MSFSDTIFLFFLALILFGPKKLPEMARQAGRLLAELRRASNEFKSQIETEIAHLEVQKEVKKEAQKDVQQTQSVLPPSSPPPGSVSTSLNAAAGESDLRQSEPPATLAAPEAEAGSLALSTASESTSPPATEAAAEPSASNPQESHV